MKWVATFYEAKSGRVRPSMCHPRFAKAREAHVLSAHGAKVSKRELRDDFFWDRGGMCKANPEYGTIALSKDRAISYQIVQAPELYEYVQDAMLKRGRHAHDGNYVRLPSWPGWLAFLSVADCRKILSALNPVVEADPLAFEAHKVEMMEALVQANMLHAKPEDEPEIRRIIGAPQAAR